MLQQVIPLLRCPKCADQNLEAGTATERSVRSIVNGTIRCRSCRNESTVTDGIWPAMGDHRAQRSIAQLLNVVPPTPKIYEKLWRNRSLGLLTHGATSPATELTELRSAFAGDPTGERVVGDPTGERVVVDLACAEGLYANPLADASTTMIAVDHSVPFLRRVVERSAGRNIVAIQALAQHLPLGSGVVDGVVMGASLNEIGDRNAAVAEMARVTRPDGRLFSMSLVAAGTRVGQLAQKLAGTGGISFPTLTETTSLFADAGFRLDPPRVDGVVARLSGHRLVSAETP